ncbi:MAG: cohesin domain-containing protein [Chloroflexota bacterium]
MNHFLRSLKGKLHLIGLLSMAFYLIPFSTFPAIAQSNEAVVRPELPTLEIGEGQIETLVIILDHAQDVYGIEVRATFDPAVVEIVDSDPDREGTQMIPGPFPQPDFLVRNTADNAAGTLQYVATQVNPTLPVNGTGIVLSIQFLGKALGEQSAFTIDFVDIADRQGRKLSVRAENGILVIVQPKPLMPTLFPTAASPLFPDSASEPATAVAAVAAESEAAPTSTPGSVANTTPTDNNALFIAIAVGGCSGALVLIVVAVGVLRSSSRSQSKKGRL